MCGRALGGCSQCCVDEGVRRLPAAVPEAQAPLASKRAFQAEEKAIRQSGGTEAVAGLWSDMLFLGALNKTIQCYYSPGGNTQLGDNEVKRWLAACTVLFICANPYVHALHILLVWCCVQEPCGGLCRWCGCGGRWHVLPLPRLTQEPCAGPWAGCWWVTQATRLSKPC